MNFLIYYHIIYNNMYWNTYGYFNDNKINTF